MLERFKSNIEMNEKVSATEWRRVARSVARSKMSFCPCFGRSKQDPDEAARHLMTIQRHEDGYGKI